MTAEMSLAPESGSGGGSKNAVPHAVEPHQPFFRAQPQVAVGGLDDGEDVVCRASRPPAPNACFWYWVSVLAGSRAAAQGVVPRSTPHDQPGVRDAGRDGGGSTTVVENPGCNHAHA